MSMPPRLTDEMRHALNQHPDQPLAVQDEQTHQIYVIVDQSVHQRAMQALRQQEDIAAIQAGLDAADEGRVSTVEEMDARIRQKYGFPPRT